ncbi:MAG: Xylosidase/arabinosidase [Pedosphaera sp.]|nr:Xylosidase/arabinosidase [Pedosphaera sp.]
MTTKILKFAGALCFCSVTFLFIDQTAQAQDPFAAYLNSIPTVVSNISSANSGSGSLAIITKRFTFSSKGGVNVVYAIIVYPQAAGVYPAVMFNHGGGSDAESQLGDLQAYAARGYVTIACDLPGICGTNNTPNSSGPWKVAANGEGPRLNVVGGAQNSTLCDAGVAALEAFNYLCSQSNVDTNNIGISGSSWGGYMTTLLSGLLGNKVKAAYSRFGCGYYDAGSFWSTMIADMSIADRYVWTTYLDAGRRAPNITAPYFIEEPSNDTYFWPEAVAATMNAIPNVKNLVCMPNLNHTSIAVSGTMKQLYFDYYLKSSGSPFGSISISSAVTQADGSKKFTFDTSVPGGVLISSVQLYYSVPAADWQSRSWIALAATNVSGSIYSATVSSNLISQNVNIFGYMTDSRTVAVSTLVTDTNGREVTTIGDVVGKMVAGYQGWFSCAGDNSPNNKWVHWSSGSAPSPGNQTFELWPDLREYTATYQTGYGNLGNGQPAKLFSPWDTQTVNTHFQWMQQYGIDCAALQRFGKGNSQLDGTATRVRNSAQAYGRKFYIMYDISGWTAFQTEMKTDWTNDIIGALNLTASSAYAKQDGKPVVCVWGVGVSGRPGNVTSWTDVVNFFKDQGCYVIVGGPRDWRTQTTNLPAYNAANMVMPWATGSFNGVSGADSYASTIAADFAYCNSHGMDYQAEAFPGFAWSNWNGGARNLIPRLHGDFMWEQFANIRNQGVPSVYVGMFDEYDEGTAIAKAAEDSSMIPTNQYFLTLDADGTHVSSDFYLRLAGDGIKMIRGQTSLVWSHPTPFVPLTAPPAMPTNFLANPGNAQISLSWSASSGASSYNVKRALVSGGGYTTIATNVGNISYIDTGLVNGTTYYYVVSAVNSLGESTNSAEASATPLILVAGTLTWDANGGTAPNPMDGSGDWSVASWWNGSANQTWVDGGSAIFGAGTPGNYTVTLSASVLASNMTFNTSGYTLSGAALTLTAPPANGTNLVVAGNVSATINNAINPGGNTIWSIGSGASLNLNGGGFNGGGNFILRGNGTNNITGGTYTPAVWWLQNVNINQSGGSITPGTGLFVGYSGNCNYTMNGASALLTVAGGSGYNFSVGRGGNSGTFNLQNGTVSVGSGFANVLLGHDSSSTATLNISGGTFTLAPGKAIYINSGANASGGSGTLNLSGGAVTTPTIQFGNSVSAYNANTFASLTVSGGALYVGSGGIIANTNTGGLPGNSSINLSGGTIGATASWSSARPMILATANGPITFQTADVGNNPFNITLSGALSGPGGLIKAGPGTLTLSGANAYTGGTTLNAGTLSLMTTNNVLMAYTNNGGTLSVRLVSVGSSLPMSAVVFGSSNPQLTFDLASLGNTTASLIAGESLTMNGNVMVNVYNAPASGTSVLLTYSGTRSGSGNFVAGTVPNGASIIDDAVGKKVCLAHPSATPPMITGISRNGASIGFSGTNGTASITYRILSTTNLANPVWLPVSTNSFDAAGNFNINLPSDPTNPAAFYRLITP